MTISPSCTLFSLVACTRVAIVALGLLIHNSGASSGAEVGCVELSRKQIFFPFVGCDSVSGTCKRYLSDVTILGKEVLLRDAPNGIDDQGYRLKLGEEKVLSNSDVPPYLLKFRSSYPTGTNNFARGRVMLVGSSLQFALRIGSDFPDGGVLRLETDIEIEIEDCSRCRLVRNDFRALSRTPKRSFNSDSRMREGECWISPLFSTN
jgi:hypothetical protein